MKKILFLIFCFVICIKTYAQEKVVFKIKYLPNHLYKISEGKGVDMKVDFTGDSVEVNKAKSQMGTLPAIFKLEINSDFNAQTGSLDSKEEFPVSINFTSLNTKQRINDRVIIDNKSPLINLEIHTKFTKNGLVQVDSIGKMSLTDSIKTKIVNLINSTRNLLSFPKESLTIGDTFIRETPFNFPMGGFSTKLKMIYTLISINNGIALFTTETTANMEMDTESVKMNMKGEGDGKLLYSIKNNFPINLSNTLNFSYEAEAKKRKVTMSGEGKVSYFNTYTIN